MLQNEIFEKIINKHKNQAEALQQISALLFLNKSNVYRRLKGEIMLKPNEIEVLVKHYKLSLDEIVHKGKKQFLFTHSRTNSNNSDKENHVSFYEKFRDSFQYIANYVPNFKSHYIGYEISVYFFGELFPEIVYFKALQWKRLNWDTGKPFFIDLKELDDYGRELIKETSYLYMNMDVPEIWDSSGLDILLEQIVYSYKLRQISLEDAQFLLLATKKSMDFTEEKARKGKKILSKSDKKFELYYSEIPLDSFMYITYNENNPTRVTAPFDSPYNIVTTNNSFVNKMYERFNRIKNQSHKISETGELTRRKVFNRYRRKIMQAEKQLIQ